LKATERIAGILKENHDDDYFDFDIKAAMSANLRFSPSLGKSTVIQLPKSFNLKNYPNPFNPSTYITYDLPEKSVVRLEIYNALGQRVALLKDAKQDAGRHVAVWDGYTSNGTLASAGIYFCRMTAGDFSKTIKMTLLL